MAAILRFKCGRGKREGREEMGFSTINHQADFCVIGGGLAGLCAAVSAARHGSDVILMQDRPMLGGNASSEVRMWVCGAQGSNNRETGILEEIMMENQYRNPDKNYSIWDCVLYGLARHEPRLSLLLNCSCLDAEMKDGRILSVTGWQTTTQKFHRVTAPLFSDCSGDSVLSQLTGAHYKIGREARHEYGESIEPDCADSNTMGMSCLIQAEEGRESSTFIAPDWAEKVTGDQLAHRRPNLENPGENFWYLELGGMRDGIGDAEEVNGELIPLAYGMWDYLKNSPEEEEKNRNWKLAWVGALAGKRESRRYIGPYVMNQNDVEAGGHFPDEVAYGGWTMDDHHPAGFRTTEVPNVHHFAPSPYGIPYRCLYSENVPNLFFAGRNISVSHAAFSSTRVMGTCAMVGQAVGTAAGIAVKEGCLPKDISEKHISRLQNLLMDDDCFLPHLIRPISPLCIGARLSGQGDHLERLRDGIDRDRPGERHAWEGKPGDMITYIFPAVCHLQRVRIIFDSDLDRTTLPSPENALNRNMFSNRLLSMQPSTVPATMVRRYRIWANYPDGSRRLVTEEKNNYFRLRKHIVDLPGCIGLSLQPLETWGAEKVRIFAFEAQ